MHTDITNISPTKIKVFIKATSAELEEYKKITLGKFAGSVKIQGFRTGKAPLSLVEKNVDQSKFQAEFLEEAMSGLYNESARRGKFRPVSQPEVAIKKFVPYSDLEFEITVETLGKIKLADYKNIKLARPKVEVTAKDVDDVLKSLKLRMAEKKEVNRASKQSDEVWIDFKGVDAKGQPINGADGKDYPLVIGSKTFIPGFEENLVGLKAGDEKTFETTFPKDYGVKTLAGKKVKFSVNVKKIQEVIEPKLDDSFAAQAGPFKTLKELKDDIKRQLEHEKQHETSRDYSNKLIEKLTEKSELSVPDSMVENQIEHNLSELKRNLTYRGQTFPEFLQAEGTTEEKYRKEVLRPQAEKQVKGSLILGEISEQEKIVVSDEELEMRIQALKAQYQDQKMQEELNKPEARKDIVSRLVTEKTLQKLEQYAAS
ncbi:MAG TPA: trigger factor [Candidatus Saccharimonadales bacterium]|nr:trigger factor [Candidatus Saccharimonadales bacterium]